MKTLTAREAKNSFGELLDMAQREPVIVTKRGRPVSVMLSIEEMQERNSRAERCRMGDEREVVCLLHRSRSQHRHASLSRCHHVAVIAKDAQCMGRYRPRCDMDYRWQQLACHLVEVRDHQQQALRGRERCGERTSLKRAVNSAGGSRLTLHFHHFWNGPPKVGLPSL